MFLLVAPGAASDPPPLRTPLREVVSMRPGSVSAVGSWYDKKQHRLVGDVVADRREVAQAATTRIVCERSLGRCTVVDAVVVDGLLSTSVRFYSIRSWAPERIEAVLRNECVELVLVLEEPRNRATLNRSVFEPCIRNKLWTPGSFELLDGSAG